MVFIGHVHRNSANIDSASDKKLLEISVSLHAFVLCIDIRIYP